MCSSHHLMGIIVAACVKELVQQEANSSAMSFTNCQNTECPVYPFTYYIINWNRKENNW